MKQTEAERKPARASIWTRPWKTLCFVAASAAVSCPLLLFYGFLDIFEALLFLLLLFFPALEDVRTGYISDAWCLALAAVGMIFCGIYGMWMGLWSAAFVFCFLSVIHYWRKDALGGGDVGLATAIAIWLPGFPAILFLWLSFFFGSLYGFFLLFSGKKTLTDGVPFGPFLGFGGAAAYLFGEKVIFLYASLW